MGGSRRGHSRAESRMEVRVAGPSRLRRRLRAAAVSGSSRRWWSPRFRGPRRSPPPVVPVLDDAALLLAVPETIPPINAGTAHWHPRSRTWAFHRTLVLPGYIAHYNPTARTDRSISIRPQARPRRRAVTPLKTALRQKGLEGREAGLVRNPRRPGTAETPLLMRRGRWGPLPTTGLGIPQLLSRGLTADRGRLGRARSPPCGPRRPRSAAR